MTNFLFFDDRYINVISGMTRVMHSPQLISKKPYVDPATSLVNLSWGYPFVYFNDELRKFIMFYQGWSINHEIIQNTIQLCASSEDGINFLPFNTNQYFQDEKKVLFNQILPMILNDLFFSEGQFFYLPELDSENKFIALCMYKDAKNNFFAISFTSKDGLRFIYHPEMAWHQGSNTPDYPMSVVYNPSISKFVIYRRPRHTDRRISFVTTKDFIHYSNPEVILQSDALDKPLTDFYGLNVINYHNQYLGFLMTYQTPNYLRYLGNRVSGLPGHKFYGGKVETQLVYGDSGIFFNRFFRANFFSNSEFNCIYPTCLIEKEDKLLIYASATPEEHGRVAPGKGSINVFELRKDGFCSLETNNGLGELITKQFLYQGGDLSFNVKSINGYIKIQIGDSDNNPIKGFEYDNCQAFSGDSVSHIFKFLNVNLNSLKDKIIVINVLSTSTNLFSISGNLTYFTPYEAMKYEGR